MAKINRFEDLICWQKARKIVNELYAVTKEVNFSKDYSLKDQIRRAGISVMLNISEGFAGNPIKNSDNFYFSHMAHSVKYNLHYILL
jgi:four helix bundle protein